MWSVSKWSSTLKVKKWELANEEASAAQVAGGSTSADLDQAMDGLICAEGPFFIKLHALGGLCMWLKEGLLTLQELRGSSSGDLNSQECVCVALQHSSLQSCRGELEGVPTHARASHFAAYEVGEAEIEMYS